MEIDGVALMKAASLFILAASGIGRSVFALGDSKECGESLHHWKARPGGDLAPYSPEALFGVFGFSAKRAKRNLLVLWAGCENATREYAWEGKRPMSAGELCDLVPAGKRAGMIGDSLTAQLACSWAAAAAHRDARRGPAGAQPPRARLPARVAAHVSAQYNTRGGAQKTAC